MNSRLWTGILLCVAPCLLVSIDFHTYVIRDAVKNFLQSKKAWFLKNNSCKADTRLLTNPRNKERLHILIVAYFRSGSTFTGSMFDANSDMFYSYEPLHQVQKGKHDDTFTMSYLNRTRKELKVNLAKREIIENIFHCKISELSIDIMTAGFWEISKASKSYWQCVANSSTKLGDCVKDFEQVCLQKKAAVIKTIRLSMDEVHDMLHDSSLKVIHLVRDPRPSLLSARKLGESLGDHASKLCTSIYYDILVTKQLLKAYPEKVKLVFYDDITLDTTAVVKDIYDFVGLPYTNEIEEYINQLGADDDADCFVCLGRSNQTYQLNKWRMTIPFKDVQLIDRKCGMLYDVSGYKPAGSEQYLRDWNNPLRDAMVK